LATDPKGLEIINAGLPSETVSGLSEPGHAGGAFGRPDLHERLERVLTKTQPAMVIACYGMNDGIYYPYSRERARKFEEGMRWLHDQVTAKGARIIHLTPPVFDPLPIKAKTLPAGLEEYPQPYVGYNDVLDRYSEWLIERRAEGWEVLDIHAAMNRALSEKRQKAPEFSLANDGVHPGPQGHWLMARVILSFYKLPERMTKPETFLEFIAQCPPAEDLLKCVQNRQRLMKDAWLTETGHGRPGMATGLPLAEAREKCAQLSVTIDALTQKLRSLKETNASPVLR
jgi:lysophospholipase L1-like esterase